MAADEPCPDCGEPLDFDEVDIGVGIQRGNPRCPSCGWEPRQEAFDEPCLSDGTPIYPQRQPTRQETLEALADRGCDTREEYEQTR